MKICILGDCHSVFLSQLVKNIKKQNPEIKIDGVQQRKNEIFEFENYFDKIIFLDNGNINKFGILGKFLKYISYKSKFRKLEKYDIVNIQFVRHLYILFWKDIKKIADKRILSFWGSDFHSISNKQREKLRNILIEVDVITFTSDGMAEEFKKYYNNTEISKKVKVCRFGIESLDSILEISQNKQNNFKKKYEIPGEKIIVAIGYSSDIARRHIDTINSLLAIDKHLLNKCHFVFQMNYGDLNYKEKVKEFLNNLSISYTVLEDFMSYKEIAEFRIETDIMINVPAVDQFSASMQEILYAKNLVITGKWLPYNLLWEKGVFALKMNDFEELLNTFKYVIENIHELKEKCHNNSKIIYELSSWKANTPEWVNLYSNVLEQ